MARRPRKPIPDAELEVLGALWDAGPGTVHDVIERLGGTRAYTTVQTLLSRLEAKGYLKTQKQGRALLYSPDAERSDLLTEELRDVANRVTGGKATPLVMNLVEHNDLSPEEIRQLRDLLDRVEDRRTRRKKKSR